ncbi:YybH family protein [Lacimicrobium alkaliphilum]|uniref:DUF4440 domain-containing protein n=1 Tax=Lacimicrobium alkaliphilum TaxID=1526571 RepID=A0A0U3AM99_9ALTE|nr:nuclear transport factor 2 family protein [Lacimicrobium alkaliphilum]ALS99106.1 hypothetical protein AT746_13085 [Lacimicrobium alkaliphilum]
MKNLPLMMLPLLVSLALPVSASNDELEKLLLEREQAFADSMAKRDFSAFKSFLADEAIFFTSDGVLKGKQAVAEGWKVYYQDEQAPFSWQPRQVEVLASGDLAHSSGPVFNAKGECFATFNSIWRKHPSGEWLVVFDKGTPGCKEQ